MSNNYELKGPFLLNKVTVNNRIDENAVGVYILEKVLSQDFLSQDLLIAKYVGRSDTDLNRRLQDHVRNDYYKQFKFKICANKTEAYKEECRLYHELKEPHGLDNDRHPDSPDDLDLECPYCWLKHSNSFS